MKTLNLTSFYDNEDNVYSYYEYDNEDILSFIKFINAIIDYCDSFYYIGNKLPNNLDDLIDHENVSINVTHYYNNSKEYYDIKDTKLFNINNVENKNILKQNLRFNLSDPDDREPIKINTDIKNITMSYSLDTNIVFVHDNKILFNFYLYDGYIYDYCTKKDKENIENHLTIC